MVSESRFPLVIILAYGLALGCGPQTPTQPDQPAIQAALQGSTAATLAQAEPATAAAVASSTRFDFDPKDFVSGVDNPRFPLRPGTRFVSRGDDAGEPLLNITEVTPEQKLILGVRATVVVDRLFQNGELAEKTFDYYAQDEDGNVWYLGEDTREFEHGKVVSTAGTWLAGKDGAKPGVLMPAHPRVGETLQQEFAAGVAEDRSRMVDVTTKVTVPFGTFHGCLETRDFTPLEPGAVEAKFYCPGVGLVKSRDLRGGTVRLDLVRIGRR